MVHKMYVTRARRVKIDQHVRLRQSLGSMNDQQHTRRARESFGVRLTGAGARALRELQRKGLPRGATPVPKGHIVERAILALAEAEGIDVEALLALDTSEAG